MFPDSGGTAPGIVFRRPSLFPLLRTPFTTSRSSATTRVAAGGRDEITHLSAAELTRRIRSGELSAREAVAAHVHRIESVNGVLNAVVAPRFEEALAEARAADERMARGEAPGPLHGVPITVKHSFDVAGLPTSIGIEHGAIRPVKDAPAVARLRQAGAIVVGKTNVGQLLIMFDTANPVFGRTANPWNTERSPGGSSGGEAAIIASRGAPLGLGSDGGGSIRQPAHSCGIHGLKPTSGRFSNSGHLSTPNFPPAAFQPGPLARSVEDLVLTMQAMSSKEPFHPRPDVAPVGLSDPADARIDSLKVGFYADDGFFPAAPAIRRSAESAVRFLADCGADVIPFDPPGVEEALQIYFGLMYADAFSHLLRHTRGSKLDWRVARMIRDGRAPTFLRPLVAGLLKWAGHPRLSRSLSMVRRRSLRLPEYWALLERRRDYVERFMATMDRLGLDAIICPPSALPAYTDHTGPYLWQAGSYTILYNLLGMPAGVVAASRVGPHEESDRPASRDHLEKAARHTEMGSAGLPVGVMVVARHWQEHVCLAVMSALEKHFSAQPDYPRAPLL